MKSITLFAATAALAVSSAAVADISYTYVDLGYVVADSTEDNENEAINLRGSFGFADMFHVGANISDGEVNGGKGGVPPAPTRNVEGGDTTGYGIYFGINPALTENMDLVARIGYNQTDIEINSQNSDDEISTLWVEVGPRAMVSENLELNAAVILAYGSYDNNLNGTTPATQSYSEDFTDVGYRVGGEYYFTPAISAGVDATVGDINAANLHVRYSFGNM